MINDGAYLYKRTTRTGRQGYGLYTGKHLLHSWHSSRVVSRFSHLMKTDINEKLTFNLSLVRQEHGNSLVKKIYNTYKKTNHGTRSNQPEAEVQV